MTKAHQLLIVGSGPAALTAALYSARADLSPIVIAGKTPGGQLMLTDIVENFPGFSDGVTGSELIERMIKQAEKFGAKFIYENATGLDLTGQPMQLLTSSNQYQAEAIILSTGAKTRWLGVPGEAQLIGRGVSSCAICDAPLYRDRVVFVVGGGDAAMEEALALAKFAKSVTIIHRRAELRASQIMQDRVKQEPKITIVWNSIVSRVVGEKQLEQLEITELTSGQTRLIPTDGLFVAIGHDPVSDFVTGHIALDERGYIQVTNHTETSVKGVFVAGDVADPHYRQAITAAGFGCMAALDAERYLVNR